MQVRRGVLVCVILGGLVAHLVSAHSWLAEARQASGGGQRNPGADWPTYNRDLAGTRYSTLTQINTKNVSTLVQTWSYRLRPEPGRSVPAIDKPASSFEIFQEVTPIVVNGVMYLPSGHRVVALAPETGKEIWRHELHDGLASFRGVAYWPGNGGLPARIFFTSLKKLIALRADTGALDTTFGNGGHIDLEIAYSGVPAIYRNVVLMGSNFFGPGERHIGLHLERAMGEKGDVHAYDARTGKKLWDFHTIPLPGETGHDTWGNDSWKGRTGNNVWSFTLTVDEQRGLVYMPVSGPGMNYYGGDRPGNNLFSNTTIALDAQTGKTEVALPEHPSRDLGLQPSARRGSYRHPERRPDDSRARAGREIGFHVHPESRGRHAGLRRRRTSAGEGRRAGEWYPADATDSRKPRPGRAICSMTRSDLVTATTRRPRTPESCRALWDKCSSAMTDRTRRGTTGRTGGPAIDDLSRHDRRRELGRHRHRSRAWLHLRELQGRAVDGWIAPNPRYNEKTKDTEFPYVQQRAARSALTRAMRTGDRSAHCPATVRRGPASWR
jgi:quinoprotein glucose dehydrogenase